MPQHLLVESPGGLGPFSERFEKIETLYRDTAFSWLLARDRNTGDMVRLQRLHLHTLESKSTLLAQWQALKSCGKSLWMRPQEFLQKNHWGLLLTWVPPGSPFSQTEKIQTDEVYLKWLSQALSDLEEIHRLGLLHLTQNQGSWILFQGDEAEGENQLGLSDVGLLTEVPLGRPLKVENVLTLAPEILRGETVGATADFYALACLILKQRSPHLWENLGRLDQILRLHWDGRLVEWVPKTKTPLNEILRSMLAPLPQDRPQSAQALLKKIEGKSTKVENTLQNLPPWALARNQARQQTLILNTIASLVDHTAINFLDTKKIAGFRELASEIIEANKAKFPKHLEPYYLYWMARLENLIGEPDLATKLRAKALSQVYEQPDPKLKAMLWVEEAQAQEVKLGINKQVLSALENAWDCVANHPEVGFREQILWEQGLRLKAQGSDSPALQKLHQAWSLGFEAEDTTELARKILLTAELAELLFNYRFTAPASKLMQEAINKIPELGDAREDYELTRPYLQVAAIASPLEASEAYFVLARESAQRQKNLVKLLWVEAHHVRALLEQAHYEQARRELRAISHRNPNNFHLDFLNLLELKLWLATEEPLWPHNPLWETRLQALITSAQEGHPFCELAWPPLQTYQCLSDFLEKKQQFSEAETLRNKAQEQKQQIEKILQSLNYALKDQVNPKNKSKDQRAAMDWLPSGAIKVESLLKEKSSESTGEIEIKEISHPEKNLPSRETKLQAKIDQLEIQLKTERKAWREEKANLQSQITKLKNEVVEPNLRNIPKVKTSVLEPLVAPKPEKEEGIILGSDEKAQILNALQTYQGHRGHAAKHLGIHRRTLLVKLKKYSLEDVSFLPSRESILQALADNQGQKSMAAKQLGLSRATFYRRLKELKIIES